MVATERGRLRVGVAPGGPWTRHGHPVDGVTVDGPGRPPVARCGGPVICAVCARDAERIRLDAQVGRAAAPQETPRDRGRDAQEAAEAHLAVCEKWLERIETEDVGEDDDGPAMAGPYDGCGVCDQRETIAAAWPHALAAAADLIEEAALAVDVETGARGRFVGLLREEARRATLAGLEPPA